MNHNQNQTWGTWDELLLACAVKRHGSKNWDSVAMEVQTRSSLPPLLTTAKKCENKYQDLKRRFKDNEDREETKEGDDDDTIPWLEELRKSRVAELRREVQRYDVSILSLQLKVKRLEEEREEKPDLEIERSETDKKDEPKGSEPETKTEKAVSGEESDRENRSVNESNSTGGVKVEPGPVQTGSGEPGPVQSGSDPKELGESVSELSGGDVQSSASLGRKRKRKERRRRRRKEVGGGGGDGIIMKRGGGGDDDVKSEPLVGFLEMIRAHQHGSFFERRLQSQETEEYKNIVRQHVDLETIQTRLDQGSYSSSTLAFYRDLMLLTNNAIVFFPKSSLESINAHELRSLVSNEMKKETQKSDSSQEQSPLPAIPPPQPKPELERLDSLLERQKSSAPIIVCRKRSSVSAKPSSNLGQKVEQQISDDKNPVLDIKPPVEESLLKMKAKEKPVTGARSSRRSNKNTTTNNSITNSSTPNKKQNANSGSKTGSADKQETLKSDKKKTEALASDKKRSVVDFLKRIKKNSPAAQTSKKSTRGGGSSSGGNGGGEEKKTRSNNSNKEDKGKERVLRRSGDKKKVKEEISPSKRVGRPPKKGAEVSVVTGKRRRESGGGGKEVKQQRKRARR